MTAAGMLAVAGRGMATAAVPCGGGRGGARRGCCCPLGPEGASLALAGKRLALPPFHSRAPLPSQPPQRWFGSNAAAQGVA